MEAVWNTVSLEGAPDSAEGAETGVKLDWLIYKTYMSKLDRENFIIPFVKQNIITKYLQCIVLITIKLLLNYEDKD